jgi:hypothetical protein
MSVNDKKKYIVRNFNEILDSLLVQTSCIIGSSYRANFSTILRINILLPIKTFLKFGLPHKDKILKKNEAFFLESDVPDNLADINENYMREILKLKNIFVQLDDVSKSNMWDIFQSLLVLAVEYSEL